MIFTDKVGHLVSDTSLEELHRFAASIGLKRYWFQGKQKRHPHYDLTTNRKRAQAIAAGAILVSSRELLHRMKRVPAPTRLLNVR